MNGYEYTLRMEVCVTESIMMNDECHTMMRSKASGQISQISLHICELCVSRISALNTMDVLDNAHGYSIT